MRTKICPLITPGLLFLAAAVALLYANDQVAGHRMPCWSYAVISVIIIAIWAICIWIASRNKRPAETPKKKLNPARYILLTLLPMVLLFVFFCVRNDFDPGTMLSNLLAAAFITSVFIGATYLSEKSR